MSNFVEVQIYNNGPKVTINLDLVQSIVPSKHKDARAIISFPNIGGEACDYFVTDSYNYLSKLAQEGKSEHGQ